MALTLGLIYNAIMDNFDLFNNDNNQYKNNFVIPNVET